MSGRVTQVAVCTCEEIKEGKPGGCILHYLVRLDDSIGDRYLKELERRAETVLKTFVLKIVGKEEEFAEPISEPTWERLQALKQSLGLRSLDQIFDYVHEYVSQRYDPDRIFKTTNPLLIIGPPGSGKTRLVKKILPSFEKVMVVDTGREYEDLPIVNEGPIFGDIWTKQPRFRYFPPDNPLYSDLALQYLFGFLTGRMKDPENPLKEYVFILEDAVRLASISAVRAFISESRKFVRKVIVVCQDPRAFEGLGDVMRP